jgi:hypothetical protein
MLKNPERHGRLYICRVRAVVISTFSTPAVMDCLAANAVCGCSFCYPVSWQIHFKSISSRVAVLTEANPTQPPPPPVFQLKLMLMKWNAHWTQPDKGNCRVFTSLRLCGIPPSWTCWSNFFIKKKLRGVGLRANYPDLATAVFQRS